MQSNKSDRKRKRAGEKRNIERDREIKESKGQQWKKNKRGYKNNIERDKERKREDFL